jgi:hypothetical protein
VVSGTPAGFLQEKRWKSVWMREGG